MQRFINIVRILLSLHVRNRDIQKSNSKKIKFYTNGRYLSIDKRGAFREYLHRTILWDDKEPVSTLPAIKSVKRYTKNYKHIIWNRRAVEYMLKSSYCNIEFYNSYTRRIMYADLVRYLILYRFGGVYLDLDIEMREDLDRLSGSIFERYDINKERDSFCILFEEYRWQDESMAVDEMDQPIRIFLEEKYRKEALIRVANYAFISSPGHPFIKRVIEECQTRSQLKVKCDYDVLFITGPDVVSHIYETMDEGFAEAHNVILVKKESADQYLSHKCMGEWRT